MIATSTKENKCMNHPTALESIAYGMASSMVIIGLELLAFYKYTGAL